MRTGTLRYQFAPLSHDKGGDPAGGYLVIDTDANELATKAAGEGRVYHIALDDLPDAVAAYLGDGDD